MWLACISDRYFDVAAQVFGLKAAATGSAGQVGFGVAVCQQLMKPLDKANTLKAAVKAVMYIFKQVVHGCDPGQCLSVTAGCRAYKWQRPIILNIRQSEWLDLKQVWRSAMPAGLVLVVCDSVADWQQTQISEAGVIWSAKRSFDSPGYMSARHDPWP